MLLKIQKSRFSKTIASVLIIMVLWFTFDVQPIQAANLYSERSNGSVTALLGEVSQNTSSDVKMVNSVDSTNVVTIKSGTPITLQPVQDLNAEHLMNGQSVDFRVTNDVKVNKKIVIPAGSIAKGVVLKADKPKMFGKAAVIEIQIKNVTTVDNQTLSLTGAPIHKEGANRVAWSWILFGISMIILWPLIFIPFFMKGDNIIIPTGFNFDFATSQSMEILIPTAK